MLYYVVSHDVRIYVLKEFGGESSARDERDWQGYLVCLVSLVCLVYSVYLVVRTGELTR